MRFLAAIVASLCIASLTLAASFPALTGRVVDDAHLLSADTKSSLEATLAAHEKATSNQIVVVTVPSLGGQEIEEYGYQLGRHWGIGQKGKDNGVLLIVAPNERRIRIEVGYGNEGVLTDALSSQIIQTIILPKFKQGNMQAGIVEGAQAIIGVLGGDMSMLPAPTQAQNEDTSELIFFILFLCLMFSQVILLILYGVAWCIAKPLSWLGFGAFLRWITMLKLKHNPKGKTFWLWLGTPTPRLTGSYGGGFTFSGGGGSFGGGGSSGSW